MELDGDEEQEKKNLKEGERERRQSNLTSQQHMR